MYVPGWSGIIKGFLKEKCSCELQINGAGHKLSQMYVVGGGILHPALLIPVLILLLTDVLRRAGRMDALRMGLPDALGNEVIDVTDANICDAVVTGWGGWGWA